MNIEILIPTCIFLPWLIFCILFIRRFSENQKKPIEVRNNFWSNTYIFEVIPSTWPTIGILCTALGIMVGLTDFNSDNIQESIPTLLKGLRLAFIATIAGIVGLIVFQKVCAVVQKSIDDDPSRPPKQSDEINAIGNLNFAIQNLQKETASGLLATQASFDKSIKSQSEVITASLGKELNELREKVTTLQNTIKQGISDTIHSSEINTTRISDALTVIQEESLKSSTKANENTAEIIAAMSKNNELVRKKFDEFSELLKKNNTEALVEVMKRATEEFNQQMSALINKLVQENFKELNTSVQSLNDWQKENKSQVAELTANFKKTTESFSITSGVLSEVAEKTASLTSDNGKLSLMIKEMSKVLIEDGKFQEVTNKLLSTIEALNKSTDSFDETSNKLNSWVRTQMNFNDKAEVIIQQLEAFKNLNGEVWDKYRSKMEESVNIITKASKSLSGDLDNINQQFVDSLNTTLTSLDNCIQRIIAGKK